MKKIEDYIKKHLFKIDFVYTESETYPVIIEVNCGSKRIGDFRTTKEPEPLDIAPGFADFINKLEVKAELSQKEQFSNLCQNKAKTLFVFIGLKLKNNYKSILDKIVKK